MLRFLAGAGSALLLAMAGFFLWQSQAEREAPIPEAPPPEPGTLLQRPATPPEATEKTKEEKRFARADRNDDGRITAAELLEPRRKPFAKLDRDGNGQLSFDEWAVRTRDKFAGADADRSGFLDADEYRTTRPKPSKKKCAC